MTLKIPTTIPPTPITLSVPGRPPFASGGEAFSERTGRKSGGWLDTRCIIAGDNQHSRSGIARRQPEAAPRPNLTAIYSSECADKMQEMQSAALLLELLLSLSDCGRKLDLAKEIDSQNRQVERRR